MKFIRFFICYKVGVFLLSHAIMLLIYFNDILRDDSCLVFFLCKIYSLGDCENHKTAAAKGVKNDVIIEC